MVISSGKREIESIDIPAVVVGMNLSGLGVVRSLAPFGVPIIAIDDVLRRPEMNTRLAKCISVPDISGEPLVGALERIAEGYSERPVLYVTRRIPALVISKNRTRLSEYFRFNLPEATLLENLENKYHVLDYAKRFKIRGPKTFFLKSIGDLNEDLDLEYPCILKPADNQWEYMKRFRKAYKVENRNELAEIGKAVYRECPSMTMVVQEWIEGEDSDIYFCLQYRDKSSKLLGSFVGRKIRAWPPGTGATASCVADLKYQSVIQQLADSLLGKLRVTGFCSVEFKHHKITNEFLLVEPTAGRTDFQEEIAALNGVNLPYIAYRDLARLEYIGYSQTKTIAGWRDSYSDKWSAELQGQSKKAGMDRVKVYDAYYRRNDPGPWIYKMASMALKKLKKSAA